jgi:hypothetical protein
MKNNCTKKTMKNKECKRNGVAVCGSSKEKRIEKEE